MTSTVFTYLTALLVVLLVVVALNFWMRRSVHLISFPPKILMAILLVPFVRLLIPLEFPFTYALESGVVYHEITQFVIKERVKIYGFSFTLWHCALLVWALGAALSLTIIVRHYRRIVSCYRHLSPTKDEQILRAVRSERARYIERGSTELTFRTVQTKAVQEPMIYGYFRPTILLPKQTFSDGELRNIIGHEMSHYFHGDLVWKWILEVICAFHWWLPFISQLKRQIYHVMELRADQAWLKGKSQQDQIHYLETLYRICKGKESTACKQPSVMALYSYGDALSLERRFRFVQNMKSDHARQRRVSVVLMTLLCLICLLSFLVVIQPIGSGENADGSIDFDSGAFYFKPSEDGGYSLYDESGYVAYVPYIDEGLKHLPIIE